MLKKILLFIGLLILITFGIIFIFDKVTGQDTFSKIGNRLSELTNKQEPVEEIQVDETPLEIELVNESIKTYEPSSAITLIANKEVFIDENSKTSLIKVKEEFNTVTQSKDIWYALEINNIGIGQATVRVTVKDEAGNEEELQIDVTRESQSLPFGMKEIEEWPDSSYTADGNDLLAQVDKEHKLIDDYAPIDLKNLNTDYLLYTNTASIMLREEAADYLKLMLEEVRTATGKNVVIASGYRPYNEQYRLYANWVRQLGQEEADKVSARPGFSEHQLGTVVDFIDQETGLELTNNFEKGSAGSWIKENAHKFGFAQSYPEGKADITGYSHEAWHYRFIGIDNATELMESGLTLKEWLEK